VSTENDSPSSPGAAHGPGATLLLAVIEGYRLALSPLFGGHCRFVPSCSRYAQEAISRHGAWRGLKLSVLRLLRCQPFSRGGIDPVP
jgi:uncharacterized protein